MKIQLGLLILSAWIAGCAQLDKPVNTATDQPANGSFAWYEWVDKAAGVSDGQGHGPDFGSSEWCHAANWRVFGKRNTDGDNCSPEWQESISKALRDSAPKTPATGTAQSK